MKYSDGFYQDLTLIRPSTPKRSTHQVEALIEKYDLCDTEINEDFLRGFEYAVTIVGERRGRHEYLNTRHGDAEELQKLPDAI